MLFLSQAAQVSVSDTHWFGVARHTMLAWLSLDASTLLLGGAVLLALLCWVSTRRPSGLPPGPGLALPLLGHLHLLAKDPRPQFWAWRRRYGDVFSLYLGGKLVVVLASYSAIREALVTLADAFSDRPRTFFTDDIVRNTGVSFTSGPLWKEQRKTGLDILRAMGMGKNVMADRIQEEVTHYIRAIKDLQGAPSDLAPLTQISIANNISSVTFGKRFQYDDVKFLTYIQNNQHMVKLISGTAVLHFLPFLLHLPGDLFRMKELKAINDSMTSFVGEQLAEHQRTLEEGAEDGMEDKDFFYAYLREIEKRKIRGDVETTLNEANLVRNGLELVVAGTDATSAAVMWTLLFLLHHPNVQDRCFQEVSEVVGLHRPPSMHDRPRLAYLEATIQEALRRGNVGPLAIHHATSRPVTFRGHVIPKDAIVIAFMTSALQDPDIWGDPDNFRPERFLDPDGKLLWLEESIPFGLGKRACMGESMARMELFLYLVTLVQQFRFLPAEEGEGQLPSLEGVFGLSHTPQPFKIRAVPRM